eukprot:9776636-Heterocapsa_arctica.AAC.1
MGAGSKNSRAHGEPARMCQRVREHDAVAQEGDPLFPPGLEVASLFAQHVEGELDSAWRVERHVEGVEGKTMSSVETAFRAEA